MIRLAGEKDVRRAFPILVQLYTFLDEETFLRKVREGEVHANYQLFGLEKNGKLVGVCGVMPKYTLYHDHCLWVCDLAVDAAERSKGYGEELLNDVTEWARQKGFHEIFLASATHRVDAHRFYEKKMGFLRSHYNFTKKLV